MTDIANAERVYVYVSPDVSPEHLDALKLTWTFKGALLGGPYSVSRSLLWRASREVREKLQELVRHAIDSRDKGCQGCGTFLKSLAVSGHDVYLALFDGLPGTGANAEIVRRNLEKRPEKLRLTFIVTERVHIPWGLIYGSDPSALSGDPGDVDIANYSDFWCIKYWSSCMYNGIDASVLGGPKKADALRILPVLNRQAFEEASGALPPEEASALDKILVTCDAASYNAEELFERYRQIIKVKNDALLYFYCHANGTRLALGQAEEITMDRLKFRLRQNELDPEPSACLMFMNGCSTAVGDHGGGFLEATGGTGSCGFIGTETEVPNIFALRFGAAFLHSLLCTGRPLLEIMELLRKKHWPLSLIYGIYCFPEFQVAPKARVAAMGELGKEENFSLSSVGTKGMKA